MESVKTKFESLIKRLNYPQITLQGIPTGKIVKWSCANMPLVVDQLEPLGWDLDDRLTWEELVFCTAFLRWYGHNVAIFITDSYSDWILANKVISYPIMSKFREVFHLETHISVLTSSFFIESEQLDDIYVSLDWDLGHSMLDLSGYDEMTDLILPHLRDKWDFLEDGIQVIQVAETELDTQYTPWTNSQILLVNKYT